MPLSCALGFHQPRGGARWNDGFYFTKCKGCGTNLVRTTNGAWHVPRGYKVVWQSAPPAHRKAGPAREKPEMAAPIAAPVGPIVTPAGASNELPIQAVLRDLQTRDLSDDDPISAVDEARGAFPVSETPADEPSSAEATPDETSEHAPEEPIEGDAPAADPSTEPVSEDEIAVDELLPEQEPATDDQPDATAEDAEPVLEDQDGEPIEPETPLEQGDAPEAAEPIDTVEPVEPIASSDNDETTEPADAAAAAEEEEAEVGSAVDGSVQESEEEQDSSTTDDASAEILQESPSAEEEQQSVVTEDEPVPAATPEDDLLEDLALVEPPVAPPAPAVSSGYDFMEDDFEAKQWNAAAPGSETAAPPAAGSDEEPRTAQAPAAAPPDNDLPDESSKPEDGEAGGRPASFFTDSETSDRFLSDPAPAVAANAVPVSPLKSSRARKMPLRKGAAASGGKRKRMSFAAQAAVTIGVALGVFALVAAVVERPGSDMPGGLDASASFGAPGSAEMREPAFVTARILNCRISPVAQATSVRKIARGSRVEILARDADWVSISHRGRQCWARARYISAEEPA